MTKLDNLQKLKRNITFKVNNETEHINDNVPNIYVANHNSILDIFYLPLSLNKDIVSLISARLIYKKDIDRQQAVNNYLNAFPIEAHGGKEISRLCLKYAKELLKNDIDLGIFPEGAYIDTKIVHRGRTGVSQILYSYFQDTKKYANLIPVGINNISSNIDLDNYYPAYEDQVEVTILPAIDYKEDVNLFLDDTTQDKNKYLHNPVDKAMQSIASALQREYHNEYIELYKKGNVIFENGETISTNKVQENKEYIERYNKELNTRYKKLIKTFKS